MYVDIDGVISGRGLHHEAVETTGPQNALRSYLLVPHHPCQENLMKKITSNARQSNALRVGLLNVICAAGLLGSLVVPMAGYAQPAKSEAPTAGHAMPAGGMNHGGDMKAMMKGMNDKMAGMTMTGNHDVDFAQMMRIHHQGAIDMAEMELKNGKDASMRKMAQEVIKAQKKEIATIDRFFS
jgi:hypothetical protein